MYNYLDLEEHNPIVPLPPNTMRRRNQQQQQDPQMTVNSMAYSTMPYQNMNCMDNYGTAEGMSMQQQQQQQQYAMSGACGMPVLSGLPQCSQGLPGLPGGPPLPPIPGVPVLPGVTIGPGNHVMTYQSQPEGVRRRKTKRRSKHGGGVLDISYTEKDEDLCDKEVSIKCATDAKTLESVGRKINEVIGDLSHCCKKAQAMKQAGELLNPCPQLRQCGGSRTKVCWNNEGPVTPVSPPICKTDKNGCVTAKPSSLWARARFAAVLFVTFVAAASYGYWRVYSVRQPARKYRII